MAKGVDSKLVDKRTVERALLRGQLDEPSYKQYLEQLPDLAEKAVPVETQMHDEDDNEDEEEPTPEAEA